MNEFWVYIKSKTFLQNLGLAAGILFVIYILLLLYIRIYTHHNRSITVPDFSDISIVEAQKILEKRHLKYEIFDSIFIVTKEKGVIIDQHPKAGLQVKKGRCIYFTINSNSPESVIMPDLVGITLREARAKIAVSGLKLGNLSYRFDLALNVVLEQMARGKKIEMGDTVLKGSAVDLILGKGLSDQHTTVPDLSGLTLEQAQVRASDAYFSIGAIIPDESITENDSLIPWVFRQRPIHSQDVLIPLGTPIDLWITADTAKSSGYVVPADDYIYEDLNENIDGTDTEEDSYNSDYN